MDVRSSDGTVETVRNDVKVLLRVIEERAYPRTTTVTHCKQLSISVCNKTISLSGTILTSALVILYCSTQYRTVTSTLDLLKKTETFQTRVSSKLSPPQ